MSTYLLTTPPRRLQTITSLTHSISNATETEHQILHVINANQITSITEIGTQSRIKSKMRRKDLVWKWRIGIDVEVQLNVLNVAMEMMAPSVPGTVPGKLRTEFVFYSSEE